MAESRHRRPVPRVVVVGAALALLLAGATMAALSAFAPIPDPLPPATPSPDKTDPVVPDDLDALQTARIDELQAFAAWLDAEGARGFVGEVGWPDEEGWNRLAETWLAVAAGAGIPSTAWAAGSWWAAEYPLTFYTAAGSEHVLDDARGQSAVLEATPEPGINVAGLEFGTERDYSSADRGAIGVEYYAEPSASYAYLADRGIVTVRLPFRWERLQPERLAPLDPAYLDLIRQQLDGAQEAGLGVVLDLHNYGAYETADGPDLLDGSDTGTLVDVWTRLDAAVGDHPAVVAYGLMNEPHDLTGDIASGAVLWERISQDLVIGLRGAGVDTTLYVPGYDWSSLARWSSTHPREWIDDPLDDFRYEAHHYWDGDGSGKYLVDYVAELAVARAATDDGAGSSR